jgi:hypothetical protein
MKKIFPLLICLIVFTLMVENSASAQSSSKLVEFCNGVAGEDATYLKDFTIELDAAGADGKAPEQRYTMVLSKGNEYQFTVCNAEGSEGKAVCQLFDISKLYGTNLSASTGQLGKAFKFQCNKTGAYHLIVSFQDGKKGSAVTIVSFVRTL